MPQADTQKTRPCQDFQPSRGALGYDKQLAANPEGYKRDWEQARLAPARAPNPETQLPKGGSALSQLIPPLIWWTALMCWVKQQCWRQDKVRQRIQRGLISLNFSMLKSRIISSALSASRKVSLKDQFLVSVHLSKYPFPKLRLKSNDTKILMYLS